jgi:hypothetical protein
MCTVADIQEGSVVALRENRVTWRAVVSGRNDTTVWYRMGGSSVVNKLPISEFAKRVFGLPLATPQ